MTISCPSRLALWLRFGAELSRSKENKVFKAAVRLVGIMDLPTRIRVLSLLGKLQYLPNDPAIIVDLGCGRGHWCNLVAKLYPGAARIIGVDTSAEQLAVAERTRCDGRIEFRTADGECGVVGGADLVLWIESLQYFEVDAVARCLTEIKHGATLFLHVPSKYLTRGTDKSFSLDSIKRLLELQAFTVRSLEYGVPPICSAVMTLHYRIHRLSKLACAVAFPALLLSAFLLSYTVPRRGHYVVAIATKQ